MLSQMSIGRAFGRLRIAAQLALAAALFASLISYEFPAVAQTQPVRGEMTMGTTGGFGRLVIRLDADFRRIFPRFLVCPRCNRLAPHTSYEFTERGARHLCTAANCRGKGNAPAFPVRFMIASHSFSNATISPTI